MSDIRVKLRDGTDRHFPDESRAGGSWETHLRYENGYVVIVDVYGKETSFPNDNVNEIIVRPRQGW